jgi:hypothetical protein
VTLFQVITPAESLSGPSEGFDPRPQQPGDQDTPSEGHRQYSHCLLTQLTVHIAAWRYIGTLFVITWQLWRSGLVRFHSSVCKTGSTQAVAHPFTQPSNRCTEGVLLCCSAHARLSSGSFTALNNTGKVRVTWYWGALLQTLLLWKNNKYCVLWVSVCGLRFSVWNAHAPQHMWTLEFFPYYLKNGTNFEKKVKEY